jgi:hypothetical protein
MQPKFQENAQEAQGGADVEKLMYLLAVAVEWLETSGFIAGLGIPAPVVHLEITGIMDSEVAA